MVDAVQAFDSVLAADGVSAIDVVSAVYGALAVEGVSAIAAEDVALYFGRFARNNFKLVHFRKCI